jgi:hypothetical protein
MVSVTPHLDQETRRAWSEYADSLRDLEGEEYDRAEAAAWAQLQSTLQALGAPIALDDPSVG